MARQQVKGGPVRPFYGTFQSFLTPSQLQGDTVRPLQGEFQDPGTSVTVRHSKPRRFLEGCAYKVIWQIDGGVHFFEINTLFPPGNEHHEGTQSYWWVLVKWPGGS